ncbi:hypothetical protein L9F63_025205, partial [Diploptera punctata]
FMYFYTSGTGSLGAGCSDPPWGGYSSAGPSPYSSYSPLQPPSFSYPCSTELGVPGSTLDPTSMGHLPTVLSDHTGGGGGGSDYVSPPGPGELDSMSCSSSSLLGVSGTAPGLNCGGTTYHHPSPGSWSSHQSSAASVGNFHHPHPHHPHHNNYPNYYTSTTSNASGGSNPGPPPPQAPAQYLSNTAAPPPTMVLYPHLYSTVNQNQIHLHLHSSPPTDIHGNIKSESMLGDSLQCYHHSKDDSKCESIVAAATGGVGGNNLTISSGGTRPGIEIGVLHHQQGMQGTSEDDRYSSAGQQGAGTGGSERQQTDPSSVWRPY